MLAQEFSIPYEDKEPPSHRKPPQETPEQRFRRMERYCFRVLCDYRNLLRRWKRDYAPNTPDEDFHPLFVESLQMKNTGCCPKCHSRNIVRVPDNPNRHASGNNIYTTTMTLFGKIPVIRYVCCDCGYVENWVEKRHELDEIKKSFG